MLHSFNLHQHVDEATHERGHTLDLVITRCDELEISDLEVHAPIISDHSPICFNLPMKKSSVVKQIKTFRKLKEIDIEKFKSDILNSVLHTCPADNIDDLVDQYNTVLKGILDKHAPESTKKVTVRVHTPWFNDSINEAKKARRRAERQGRSSKLSVHLQIYKAAHRHISHLCTAAKSSYYCDKIKSSNGDQKQLFKISNELLHKNKCRPLPTHSDSQQLANEFQEYFTNKINKIRESFPPSSASAHSEDRTGAPEFNAFEPTHEQELKKIILSSNSKSCVLDPIPTSLIKQCIDAIVPILVQIINRSFSSKRFPDSLKLAIVIPLLKKILLDIENKKNFRPVSNLPFLGKLIEKTAVGRFKGHITKHELDEILQSAYKELHSVETALVKVYDDMLCALDSGKCVMLALLDFSAAFDTIDHEILFKRLYDSFGIAGDAADWLKSYFTNRSQVVNINGSVSEAHALEFGMPQGSVLGPFSFPKYAYPIGRIADKHGLKYHLYADDSQIYLVFDVADGDAAKTQLEDCISEMRQWVSDNMLKLNDQKTEFMVIQSKHSRNTPDVPSISIGDAVVPAVESARNIGVIMDHKLTMYDHVNSIAKSSYAQLRSIALIRRYLTQDAAATLIHSFVTSRLDNCNALLYGLPDNMIRKLQCIQNHAAKIVLRKKKFDHVTPLLQDLHWLPVSHRIEYKIIFLTHKCLQGKAPSYLSTLLQKYVPARSLRSGDQHLLVEKRSKLKSYGDRAFSVAAPRLWNSLPLLLRNCEDLEVFKGLLKTHLFKHAFNV